MIGAVFGWVIFVGVILLGSAFGLPEKIYKNFFSEKVV